MVKRLKVVTVAPVCKTLCLSDTCTMCGEGRPLHIKERGSQATNGFLAHLMLMVIST